MRFKEKISGKKDNNKEFAITILLILLAIIMGSITIVAADNTADGINIGKIQSSDFDINITMAGAGNQFTIGEDGSPIANAESDVDNKYSYNIVVDISSLNDSTKEEINQFAAKDGKTSTLILSDGNSEIHFTSQSGPVNMKIEGNKLTIEGNGTNKENQFNFDFDNAKISACKIMTSSDSKYLYTENYS